MNMASEERKAGIILVDKPAGMSSAAVVARIKRSVGAVKKIGHAGTLDPMATGLLVCLVNSATRLASYAEAGAKCYSGSFVFGIETSSNDIEGEVTARSNVRPTLPMISALLPKFSGEIEQTPPAVSAVKVNGKRAYKLAREGKEPVLKSRKVNVSTFSLLIDESTTEDVRLEEVSFRIRCSKGTYIRSIARDLGKELGCGAALSALRREDSAPFSVLNAVELDDVAASDIIDWAHLFPSAPRVLLDEHKADLLKNGNQLVIAELSSQIEEEQSDQDVTRAVCVRRSDESSIGLLVRDTATWRLAANFV